MLPGHVLDINLKGKNIAEQHFFESGLGTTGDLLGSPALSQLLCCNVHILVLELVIHIWFLNHHGT